MRDRAEIEVAVRAVERVILENIGRSHNDLSAEEVEKLKNDVFHLLAPFGYWKAHDLREEAAKLDRVRESLETLFVSVQNLSDHAESTLRILYHYRWSGSEGGLPFKMDEAGDDPSGIRRAVESLREAYGAPLVEAAERLVFRDELRTRPPSSRGGRQFDREARMLVKKAERVWREWGMGAPAYGYVPRDVKGGKETLPNSRFTWFLKDLCETLNLRTSWLTLAQERAQRRRDDRAKARAKRQTG